MKLSNGQMPGSVEAAKEYNAQYPGSPAEAYLIARGLNDLAKSLRPGYVGLAKPGHEPYQGRLAIPYLRPAAGDHAVATIRFRCIADECVKDGQGNYLAVQGLKEHHEGHSKYMSLPGDPWRLYNTTALNTTKPYVALVEGELSAWAVELDGIPAVGIQGVKAWRNHFHPPFKGFEKVFLLGDGDEYGKAMNKKLAETLKNAVPISLPDGEDADSYRLKHGPGSIRALCGID